MGLSFEVGTQKQCRRLTEVGEVLLKCDWRHSLVAVVVVQCMHLLRCHSVRVKSTLKQRAIHAYVRRINVVHRCTTPCLMAPQKLAAPSPCRGKQKIVIARYC